MLAVINATDSVLMSETRGDRIQRRLDDMGLSDREFSVRSGVDRKTLRRAVSDDPTVRANTYRVIEDTLAELEQRNAGLPAGGDPEADLFEYEVDGPGGFHIVARSSKRDPEALNALADSVARLLREMGRSEK